MAEEENKAIETINLFLNKPVRFKNKNIIANNEIEAIDIILNLIEKLKKENEEFKKQLTPTPEHPVPVEYQTSVFVDKRDYIPKDKIREKIKELDNWDSEYYKRVTNHIEYTLTELVKNILSELLEEEQ